MTTHTNILARRIPYREGSGGLPWHHKKSDMAECLSTNLIPFVIDNKILQNVAYDYYSYLILYTLPTTHALFFHYKNGTILTDGLIEPNDISAWKHAESYKYTFKI